MVEGEKDYKAAAEGVLEVLKSYARILRFDESIFDDKAYRALAIDYIKIQLEVISRESESAGFHRGSASMFKVASKG